MTVAIDVKDYPILFSGAMVKAIREGRKTKTRRVLNRNKLYNGFAFDDPRIARACPYGQAGSRLWVRETWWGWGHFEETGKLTESGKPEVEFVLAKNTVVSYVVDQPTRPVLRYTTDPRDRWHKRPSIFMPRWASRITLEITDGRVEKLQDISEEDAQAEGITERLRLPGTKPYYALAFSKLWDSINAKRGYGWATNPWVWVISFKQVQL